MGWIVIVGLIVLLFLFWPKIKSLFTKQDPTRTQQGLIPGQDLTQTALARPLGQVTEMQVTAVNVPVQPVPVPQVKPAQSVSALGLPNPVLSPVFTRFKLPL